MTDTNPTPPRSSQSARYHSRRRENFPRISNYPRPHQVPSHTQPGSPPRSQVPAETSTFKTTFNTTFPVFVPSLSWYKDGVWYEMARQRCTQRTSPTVRARGGTVTSCERERRCCWRCSISSLELPLPCGYAHNRDERAASDESTHTFQAKNATIKSKQKWSPRSARTETVIA